MQEKCLREISREMSEGECPGGMSEGAGPRGKVLITPSAPTQTPWDRGTCIHRQVLVHLSSVWEWGDHEGHIMTDSLGCRDCGCACHAIMLQAQESRVDKEG